jgi:4-alpha-glucanotransferase
MTALRERLGRLTGCDADAPATRVIEGTYAALAEAPSAVITATLEDALAVEERPNMPGTTVEWPNWSIALPAPLESLETAPLPRRLARILGGRGKTRVSRPRAAGPGTPRRRRRAR